MALLCVPHYLRSTISQSLLYSSNSSLPLWAYFDAIWADDPDTRRSTNGFYIFLAYSFISWCSKHQDVLSRLSTEAKYRAMAHTSLELRWLRDLLCNMSVSVLTLIPVYCDNKSVFAITSNHVFHNRTKHSEVDCHITL